MFKSIYNTIIGFICVRDFRITPEELLITIREAKMEAKPNSSLAVCIDYYSQLLFPKSVSELLFTSPSKKVKPVNEEPWRGFSVTPYIDIDIDSNMVHS